MQKLGITLILLLSTAGCIRVGPPYKIPSANKYEEWTESNDPHISNEEDLNNWNALFDDPRLQQLINVALAQNYSLKAATWRIQQARATLQIATGAFFPQFQEAFGSWESVKISKNAPNARFVDKKFKNALIGFAMSWELDFWGRYRSAIDAANYNYEAAQTDYFGVKLMLTADIARAYINLCTFINIHQVIEQNIKLQQRSKEIIYFRLEAGLVSELDLQQAQVLLSNTEALLPLAEREIVNQQNALALLLGTTPDEISCILNNQDLSIPFIPSTVAVGIPANLLSRRPDLIAAKEQILSQTAIVGVSETDLLPQISLFGVIGYDAAYGNHLRATNANKNLFSMKSLTYAFGPEFNWPLFNYGRIEGRIALEWARLQEMIEQYRNMVLNAYQEAENSLIGFIKAHEEKIYLENSLQAALRAYSLSQELYLEGLVDYERVLEAQRSLVDIENQYVRNNGNIGLFFVQMYQALGGTIWH